MKFRNAKTKLAMYHNLTYLGNVRFFLNNSMSKAIGIIRNSAPKTKSAAFSPPFANAIASVNDDKIMMTERPSPIATNMRAPSILL